MTVYTLAFAAVALLIAGAVIDRLIRRWRDERWYRREAAMVRDRLDEPDGFPRGVPGPPGWQEKRSA